MPDDFRITAIDNQKYDDTDYAYPSFPFTYLVLKLPFMIDMARTIMKDAVFQQRRENWSKAGNMIARRDFAHLMWMIQGIGEVDAWLRLAEREIPLLSGHNYLIPTGELEVDLQKANLELECQRSY